MGNHSGQMGVSKVRVNSMSGNGEHGKSREANSSYFALDFPGLGI